MAYLNNIPQPADDVSQSQAQILGNFAAIGTMLAPDNGALNFPLQIVDPVLPGVPGTSIELYGKAVPAAPIPAVTAFPVGYTDLYLNRFDGVNTQHIPITLSAPGTNGFSYLPSGMILKWGTATANANATTNVLYDAGNFIPVFNNVLTVQLTLKNVLGVANNANITYVNTNALSLNVYLTNPAGGNLDFCYMIVGY